MATSGGHLYHTVVKNYKLLRLAWKHTSDNILHSIRGTRSQLQLQAIPVRNVARHPIHPVALLRQTKARHYATRSIGALRNFASSVTRSADRSSRVALPTSRTSSAVTRLTGRAPFATTLRPNLTGGAIGRSVGGYSLGSGRVGGKRYFSHGPAAPSEVINNVSQAVRAFWLSGHKAQYCGTNGRGDKRFKTVSTLRDETSHKIRALPKTTPGSFVEFSVNPTITALAPLHAIAGYSTEHASEQTLKSHGLLDVLSTDFSRALKDLAAIMKDLHLLSELGDLPISYRDSTSLRVHFPGCDAGTVEALCDEVGVRRGVIMQDDNFDAYVGTEIALLFPFAPERKAPDVNVDFLAFSAGLSPHTPPSPQRHNQAVFDWQSMLESKEYTQSAATDMDEYSEVSPPRPGDGLFSLESQDHYEWSQSHSLVHPHSHQGSTSEAHSQQDPFEYQDFEGIYRFIELCDASRR